jgi:hypothetical protein
MSGSPLVHSAYCAIVGPYPPQETDMTLTLGTVQCSPATPVALYTSTSARCQCGATIMLRTDGYWTHGGVVGLLCPEPSA